MKSLSGKELRATVTLIGLVLSPFALADDTNCGVHLSDTVFGRDVTGQTLLGGAGFDADSSAPIKHAGSIFLNRVVGPGTSGEFNADGTLANWQTYVSNGILSAKAYLYLGPPVTLGEPDSTLTFQSISVYVNDHFEKDIPVPTAPTCVDISTQHLKFAPRTPGQPQPDCTSNQSACVENKIGFVIAETQQHIDGDGLTMGLATLAFKAMAPIVMVHGWNSGPSVWGPSPADGTCGQGNGGNNFVQALKDAKAPFDCTIQIDPQASSEAGGEALLGRVAERLSEFGSRHVNLITHSKGGLFARDFLVRNAEELDSTEEIGVVSLTTLDTPHHGSVMADSVVKIKQASRLSTAVAALLSKAVGLLGAGANDLTVNAVSQFNDNHVAQPDIIRLSDSNGNIFDTKPFYFSTSADADQNGDGVLSSAEAAPYILSGLGITINYGNAMYQAMARGKPVGLFRLAGLLHASASPADNPIQNDCLVSITSAQYNGFRQINSYTGINGANHHTIVNSGVAGFVLGFIQMAESQQPGPPQ